MVDTAKAPEQAHSIRTDRKTTFIELPTKRRIAEVRNSAYPMCRS
jgi:hypothetical protein